MSIAPRKKSPFDFTPVASHPINIESDPNGIAPNTPGAKLDAGKPPLYQGLLDYFPRASLAVSDVSRIGATKYTWKGWEKVENGLVRYRNAMVRHIVKESIEGPFDKDPSLPSNTVLHAAQVAWNALAALELMLRDMENEQEAQDRGG